MQIYISNSDLAVRSRKHISNYTFLYLYCACRCTLYMPARMKWTLASLQVYLVRAGSHEVDLGLRQQPPSKWTLSTPARTKSTFAFISISLEVHFVRARPQEVNLWPSSASLSKWTLCAPARTKLTLAFISSFSEVDFAHARSHKVNNFSQSDIFIVKIRIGRHLASLSPTQF